MTHVRASAPPPYDLDLSTSSIAAARRGLTDFVLGEAIKTSTEVGFQGEGMLSEPRTYRDLQQAYQRSVHTGAALPVSDRHLRGSLLLHRRADLALRFWHDVMHVRRRLDFSTPAELDLGLWHVAVAKANGLSPLAVALLDAELVGQALLYASTKRSPGHQMRFDIDVVMFGIADAIVLEKERRDRAPSDREKPRAR